METGKEVIIGIDLAALGKNLTGWAYWKDERVSTCYLHRDEEVTNSTIQLKPCIVAIDNRY